MLTAFVVMPYRPDYERVYSTAIKPTLTDLGFVVTRADGIPASTIIADDIEKCIQDADLVVVEATEPNENVYYEIGLAVAFKKELLLLTQQPSALPADTRHRRHLVYESADLENLRFEFTRWAQATTSYRRQYRHVPPSVMTRGEIFDRISDSVFFNECSEETIQDLLLAEVRDGCILSCKYSYATEMGAIHWLRLCRDPLYTVYHESISNLSACAPKLLETCGNAFLASFPDVISLGPGDGNKDRILLLALAKRFDSFGDQRELFYYPFDVSELMLSTAKRTILAEESLRGRLKFKSIHSDFARLNDFLPVIDFRPEPNLFLFFGNTLGNMQNEISFLLKISQAMHTGDVLILEVRLRTDDLTPGGPEPERHGVARSVLALLGVALTPESIQRDISFSVSQIPETRSLVTRLRNVNISGQTFEEINLSCINFYDRDSLRRVLESVPLAFEVLGVFDTRQLGIFVLRKQAKRLM